MNNFKELAKLNQKMQNKISSLYEELDEKMTQKSID